MTGIQSAGIATLDPAVWDDVARPALTRLEGDVTADVCVVGLGGSGLINAFVMRQATKPTIRKLMTAAMTRPGLKTADPTVHVIASHVLGSGETAATTGMMMPSTSAFTTSFSAAPIRTAMESR